MYQQVAVILDESPEAGRALEAAISIASSLGSHLHILTVVRPLPMYAAYAEAADPQIAQIIEQDHLDVYGQLDVNADVSAGLRGVSVSHHSVQGVDVENIVSLLRTEKADLLVLGLHRKTATLARLWNRVFELAQDSPCSVLGVH